MPFIVVSPPSTDEDLKRVGKKVIDAAFKLGRPLDVEGFLKSWILGTRVIAETDAEDNYIGLAFVAMGDRWLFDDSAVSVMWKNVTDEAGFEQFIRAIGTAFGAKLLFIELNEPISESETESVKGVRRIKL